VDSAPAVRRLAVLGFVALIALTQPGAATISWRVDHDASRIEMSVRALGGSHVGRFSDWHGDIAFDPDAPDRTRASVVVQSASLAMTPAVATRRATGPAFLDAARYPQIRFDLRALEPLGGDRYTARAAVTMKGATRPVTFPVDLRLTGDRAHLTGAFVVNRTDFGIGTAGPWNGLVGRQVTVRVALQARRS
jgi:polyisoprenoid-binding protein YceI